MESEPQTSAPPPAKRRSRRWLRRIVVAFLALAFVYFAAPSILGWIISIKLRSEIADRLNAKLELGRVTYLWPYGVRIEHARLIPKDDSEPQIPLFDIERVELTLAKMPIGTGPLLIRQIEINDPLVHIVRHAQGAVVTSLVKSDSSVEPDVPNKRLSDLFELHRLILTGGRIQFDDQTKRKLEPVIWHDLDADLRATPTSRSGYDFEFTAKNPPLATVDIGGDIDIDTLLLNILHFKVVAETDPAKPAEQLPPVIQAVCKEFAIGGQVSIDARANFSLNDIHKGTYAALLSLKNGSCHVPGWDAPISPVELTLSCGNSLAGAPTTLPTTLPAWSPDVLLHLGGLKIACGDQFFRLDSCEGRINPTDRTWAIGRIIGKADLGNGPGPVQRAGMKATLPFAAAGTGMLGTGDFLIRLSIDDGSAEVVPIRMAIGKVATALNLTRDGLKITGLIGTVCGGDGTASGEILWNDHGRGMSYTGKALFTNLDMRQVANTFMKDEKARKMASGVGELDGKLSGGFPSKGSAVDALKVAGDFDIRHGHFMDIPVLKDVLSNVQQADAATVGEAAATFKIANRVVHFDQAAANAPAVGVLGNGDLGFDGAVNMTFIVTPLADWREKVASSDVPILSTIGAMIAGKVQHAVDVAERVALYQYRVTGQISDPKTESVPAPAITDAIGPLFRKMSGKTEDGDIGKELKRREEEEEKAKAATQKGTKE